MGQRVDARDVLDPNARTRRTVPGTIVGEFRRAGADPWDDYEFHSNPPTPTEVRPGLEIQLEPRSVQFRLRREGKVLRIAWEPSDEERERAGSEAPSALRRVFLEEYAESYQEQAGRGEAAVIVRKLQDS